MNDFTKEELNILYKCIRISEMEYGESNDLDNMKFKIKSMIDNYCEHDEAIEAGKKVMKKYSKTLDNLKDR